jgi:fructuronate reductase
VRVVHLGLGSFHRAHQAWYTERSPDAEQWGTVAFTGRRADLADRLAAQDGLYTLVTRGGAEDAFTVVASLSAVRAAADHDAWLASFALPDLAVVSTTVTEGGYLLAPGGRLDLDRPELRADLEALRSDPGAPVRTVPARLVAGLAARRAVDGGPLALVPCDNLPGNGSVVEGVVREAAALVDPGLGDWCAASVSVVATAVDRITPRPDEHLRGLVAAATGIDDAAPVVTEPYAEWVLAGTFPAGRPRWDDAGATFTDDVGPFEERKLWLLNGAHSLLAYAGSIRGHATVDRAVADATCRRWVEDWWDEAGARLGQPQPEVAAYRTALLERFGNARMGHRLAQIAADGSQKLPVRILPVLRADRADGAPATGAARVLAAWLCHLRGLGAPVDDVRSDEVVPWAAGPLPEAVRRILGALAPDLADDVELRATVVEACGEVAGAAVGS